MVELNKYVSKITPYKPVHSLKKILEYPENSVFKLDWNEATISPSKKVLNAVKAFLDRKNNIHWYSDPEACQLKEKLSEYTGLSHNQILVTNGSDHAHELICNAYLQDGDEVIVPVPTYANFKIWPLMRGAKIVEIPYEIQSKCDFSSLIKYLNHKTKIIYIINPYICLYEEYQLRDIVKAAPNAIIIIDEAYYEFYGKSAVSLMREYNNVIITRSFSKALMLAGLRLGYILSNEKVIQDLSKIHNFKSVNVLAQVAGTEVLKDIKHVQKYVNEAKKSVLLLANELQKLDFEVLPTNAGFLIFKHKVLGHKTVLTELEKEKVFVRDLSSMPNLEGFLRMNAGTLRQTKNLIQIFKKFFRIKAIFIDRDGTLVEEPYGTREEDKVITKIEKLRLLPHTIQGLIELKRKGYSIFVVTNQDGINRGQLSWDLYNKMNEQLENTFLENDIKVTKWLTCPHLPEEKCKCRKPQTGLIKELLKEYQIDLKKSYFIGDRESDINLGKKLKSKTILIKWDEKEFANSKIKPTFQSPNLQEAAKHCKS